MLHANASSQEQKTNPFVIELDSRRIQRQEQKLPRTLNSYVSLSQTRVPLHHKKKSKRLILSPNTCNSVRVPRTLWASFSQQSFHQPNQEQKTNPFYWTPAPSPHLPKQKTNPFFLAEYRERYGPNKCSERHQWEYTGNAKRIHTLSLETARLIVSHISWGGL